MDDCLEELLFDWREAISVEFDFGDKCQTIHIGFERTDIFTQFSWQHWEGFVRQISGKASLFCLFVDGCKVGDIVADVGDGNIEDIALPVKIDGIIKIFCRDRVDRTKIQSSEIDTLWMFITIDCRFDTLCLFDTLRGEGIGTVIKCQGYFFIDFGVVQVPKHFDHLFSLTVDFEYRTDFESFKIHSFHHGVRGERCSDVAYFEIARFVSIGVGDHKTMCFFDDQYDLTTGAPPSCDDAFGYNDIAMSGISQVIRFDQQIFLLFELRFDIAAPIHAQKEFTDTIDRSEFPEPIDLLDSIDIL